MTPVDRQPDREYDEERELMGVWLSRVMFNEFVGWPAETRTFEEYVEAVKRQEATR